MNDQAIDIERIVREVLAALTVAPSAAPSISPSMAAAPLQQPVASIPAKPQSVKPESVPSAPAVVKTPSPDTLTLTQNIVTMNDITGRLNAVRRLVVPGKAIVTPAVQDELLRRNIECVRSDAAKAEKATLPRLALICMGTKFDPASLIAVLGREGIAVEASHLDCVIASTQQLATELAMPNTLALLLTRHTAAGLCLANRLRGVRAVTGNDVPSVAVAIAAVGANMLVVNPQAYSFFQVKQMVAEFCRGGVRACPEVFAQQLS